MTRRGVEQARWLLLIGLVLGWAFQVAAEPPSNIVLIVVDGLRADHLACYGYHRKTMPNLERRVNQAVLFRRAVTQASWTLPSFASLFSSRYVHDHGVYHMNHRLAAEEVLLTEVLQAAGYRTAGFVGGPFLEPQFGFARGFDVYRAGGSRLFTETAPQAAQWIREHADRPFFVLLHGNDAHPPFNLPRDGEEVGHPFDGSYQGPLDSLLLDYFFVKVFNRYPFSSSELGPDADYAKLVDGIRSSPRDIEHLVAHYDGQLLAVDDALEPVFRELERSDLDDHTIVVFTSDHGLEMAEKGVLATGYHATVWQSINWVPLMIWGPQAASQVVEEPVELVDVAPTLLELVGVPVPERYQGQSVTSLMVGTQEPREHLAFSTSTVVTPGNSTRLHSAQNQNWKLIHDVVEGRSALYNLTDDPGEDADVSTEHPEIALRLLGVLLEHLDTSTAL